jgi:hypothetical protein
VLGIQFPRIVQRKEKMRTMRFVAISAWTVLAATVFLTFFVPTVGAEEDRSSADEAKGTLGKSIRLDVEGTKRVAGGLLLVQDPNEFEDASRVLKKKKGGKKGGKKDDKKGGKKGNKKGNPNIFFIADKTAPVAPTPAPVAGTPAPVAPTPAPVAPTSDLVNPPRASAIYDHINSITFVEFDIQGSATPEESAVQWLVDEDPLQLVPPSLQLDQRYALLVAWYHSTFTTQTNWLTAENECTWYGVRCEGAVVTEIDFAWDNGYVGIIPSDIAILSSLTLMDFEVSDMSGSTFPDSIGTLGNLEVLFTRESGLGGPIPTSFQGLSNLKVFQCQRNELTGMPLLVAGEWWTQLTKLDIRDNKFSGQIPSSIGNLVNLKEIGVNGNAFSGTLPSEIGLWANIEVAFFSRNNFFGELPFSIGNLVTLRDFGVNDNAFTSTLPSEIGLWTNIEKVYFFNNKFAGELPSSIAAWNPIFVEMSGNSFQGPLPDLSQWTRPQDFVLFDNQFLSGPLPDAIGQWTDLKIFSIYNNRFTGMDTPVCVAMR